MKSRSDLLLAARPILNSITEFKDISVEERFQNITLRPILKLQNPLLIEVFKNYISTHKGTFYTLSLEKKIQYIESAVQKDSTFRNSLKGIILGQFTVKEYKQYTPNATQLNKRMMTMLIERLKSQLQLFEEETLLQK